MIYHKNNVVGGISYDSLIKNHNIKARLQDNFTRSSETKKFGSFVAEMHLNIFTKTMDFRVVIGEIR